jgi:DNA-binding MarR family transcriptional regulator
MTANPKPDSPARMFREIARIHVRAQRAAVACHGGSETQCTILAELGRASSLSMSELSARLRLDKGWVSRTIDQLVSEGTVNRAVDPDDRRAVVLSLTASGRRQYRALEQLLDSQIEQVFARLRVADRAKVAAALTALYDAYSEATAADTPALSPSVL